MLHNEKIQHTWKK